MTVTLGGIISHEYFLQYSSQFAQCTWIPYRPTLMLPMWMFSILCVYVLITLYFFIIITITFLIVDCQFVYVLYWCIAVIWQAVKGFRHYNKSRFFCVVPTYKCICVFMLNDLCSFGPIACDIIKKLTVMTYVLHCWTQMTMLIYS